MENEAQPSRADLERPPRPAHVQLHCSVCGLGFDLNLLLTQHFDERHKAWCEHCDQMFYIEVNADPEFYRICPACEATGHEGGICSACQRQSSTQPESDRQTTTAECPGPASLPDSAGSSAPSTEYVRGVEAAAGIAHYWAASHSCDSHDYNPCCHVRTGSTIEKKIRALITTFEQEEKS